MIEATERGLGAEAFQTPVLDAKIAEFSLMSRDGEPPVLLMRSESTDDGSSHLGTFEFSP